MDLIDRYLIAIRWNLPRAANADDVIAELRDLIASRIEDREESLGRPLSESEVSALLRDFGHPLVVAARYGTQQSLIGPDLFPFYWFSLKVVLAICAAVIAINSALHVATGGEPLMRAVMHGVNNVWWSLLANAGLVTLIFAVIERTRWLTEYLDKWKPEELPDLSDFTVKTKPKSGWEAAWEVAFGIAFILWWAGLIPVPIAWTNAKGLTLTPDPVWTAMWWPILALLVARLVFNAVQWLRPRWKLARGVLSIATAAGAVAVLAIVYQAGHWLTASSATMSANQLADIDRSTNLGINYAIIAIGVIWVLQCAKELWGLYMSRR